MKLHQTFGTAHTLARFQVATSGDSESRALANAIRGILSQASAQRRDEDRNKLREGYRYLLSQVETPTEELERARGIIARLVQD